MRSLAKGLRLSNLKKTEGYEVIKLFMSADLSNARRRAQHHCLLSASNEKFAACARKTS